MESSSNTNQNYPSLDSKSSFFHKLAQALQASSKYHAAGAAGAAINSTGIPNNAAHAGSTCFDFIASLWVVSMEKMVPSIEKEFVQEELMVSVCFLSVFCLMHSCLMYSCLTYFTMQDTLQSTRSRIQARKMELSARLADILKDAQKLQGKKDLRTLKKRIVAAQKVKHQIEKMDNSILIMDDSIDAIINNEMDKDIIYSLQQSTARLKSQIAGIGGVDNITEVLNELNEEMTNQKNITDALSEPTSLNQMHPIDHKSLEEGEEEELQRELASLLELDADKADEAVAATSATSGTLHSTATSNQNKIDTIATMANSGTSISTSISRKSDKGEDHPASSAAVYSVQSNQLKQRKQMDTSHYWSGENVSTITLVHGT